MATLPSVDSIPLTDIALHSNHVPGFMRLARTGDVGPLGLARQVFHLGLAAHDAQGRPKLTQRGLRYAETVGSL